MEDREVISALVHDGTRTAFGPSLHIEGDCLMLDGWWQLCFRVSQKAFAVRSEEPPRETDLRDAVVLELTGAGFHPVDTSQNLLYAITYTDIALGFVNWELWSLDAATMDAELAARAGADAFLGDYSTDEPFKEPDYTAEIGGARRTAGLPPSIVLTVGVDDEETRELQGHLSDCRFVARTFDTIRPDACGAIIPSVVLIDARAPAGREFVMELRAAACGRFLPVAAITADRQVPLGADIALDPADPATWVDPIRRLLP